MRVSLLKFAQYAPVTASFQELLFFLETPSAQRHVACGEPAKATNNLAMRAGVEECTGPVWQPLQDQTHSTILILKAFRMFEGQIEKLPRRRLDTQIPAVSDRFLGRSPRLRVRLKCPP